MPNNHSDVRYVVQHLPVSGANTKRKIYKVETSIGWKVHIKEQALSASLCTLFLGYLEICGFYDNKICVFIQGFRDYIYSEIEMHPVLTCTWSGLA